MTAVYIIGGILLFLLILLIVPVSVCLDYSDRLIIKVSYGGIKVFDSGKPKKEKAAKPEKEKKSAAKKGKKKPEKQNFISRIFKEKGTVGGVKFCFEVIKSALSRIIWVIRRIKIKKLILSITVSSDDAANTAVVYGAVCAAVFPVTALIKENTKIGVEQISVSTDFDKLSPVINAAVSLKTRLVYAVIAAVSMLFSYVRIKKESEKNER
ncbi:MAG: DUF2953 domain-containing protein [Clostridia bacterium]|nr:DUF2953 domain-containing protein [Clostridia bacterium]